MSDSKEWAAIIPEFYYDLISRIPAGMILLSIIIISALSQTQMCELKTWLFSGKIEGFPFVLIFIIIFGTGYIISIPLTMIGAIVHILYGRVVWYLLKKIYPAEVSELEKHYESKAYQSKFYRLIHDDLKQRNKQALVLLPKMSAEVSLCDNITAALLLALFFIAVFSMASQTTIRILLCIATFSFIGGAYRFHRLMARNISFAKIEKIIINANQVNR